MSTAVYAGSFDPITKGHLDLILRAAKEFNHLYVAVGVNSAKKPLFTTNERKQLIRDSIADAENSFFMGDVDISDLTESISVDSFEGLLVDFCKSVGANIIIRGLRAVSDFEAEMAIADANRSMVPEIDTFFIPTRPKYSFVSSSTVREIARHPSDTGWSSLSQYVPPPVEAALKARLHGK